MFGDSEGEIRKINAALKRTRESLKMSSLVFSWSLNANGGEKDGQKVERGFGYTGLAAALDRLEPEKEKEKVTEKEVVSCLHFHFSRLCLRFNPCMQMVHSIIAPEREP